MRPRPGRAEQDPVRALPSEKACLGSGKASQADRRSRRPGHVSTLRQASSGAGALDLRPLRGQGQCREPCQGRQASRGGQAQEGRTARMAVPARAAPPPARTPEVHGHMRQVWSRSCTAGSNHLRDLRPKASRSGSGAPRACQGSGTPLRRPRSRGEAQVRPGEQPPPGGSPTGRRKMHSLRTWLARGRQVDVRGLPRESSASQESAPA